MLSPYDGLSHRHPLVAEGRRLRHARAADAVVTGQDAEVPSVKSIIAGEQYSTVFKDTRELAKVTANMVDAVLHGQGAGDQRHQDLQQRREGRSVLPAEAGRRRQANWKEVLVGSGYYTEDQIK